MLPGILRIQLALVRQRRPIVAALLIVGLVGVGGTGWVYAHPPVEEVTERANVETIATEVETSAVVVGNSTLWEEGTNLQNRRFYPAAAPNFTLRAITSVPDEGTVHVTHEISLIFRATSGEEVYVESENLLVRSSQTVVDGEASTAVVLETPSIHQRLKAINDELTGIASADAELQINTSYETERYSGSLSSPVSLRITESGYLIDGSSVTHREHSTPVTREITRPPDTAAVLGLGGVGLIALFGAALGHLYTDRLPSERALRNRISRRRYEEWISKGRLRGDLGDRRVELRSLEDLVNIAIDSEKRTLYDPDRGLYGVIDDPILYYYPEEKDGLLRPKAGDEWEWPFKQLTEEGGDTYFEEPDSAGESRRTSEQTREEPKRR